MGQKINPTGFRVGVTKKWDSTWYADKKNFGEMLVSDNKLRDFLKETLAAAGVPKVEIERDAKRIRINIHCEKPGIVIGKQGSEVEKLKANCQKILNTDKDVYINIIEIKQPDLNAQLVAENIAAQLERRVAYRRAVKGCIGRTMRSGAKGIKIRVGGRLNGAEIARAEAYHEGTIPLQTIRADIDYGFAEAKTTAGRVGIKVWIYKGEILRGTGRTSERSFERKPRFADRKPRDERRPARRPRAAKAPEAKEGGDA